MLWDNIIYWFIEPSFLSAEYTYSDIDRAISTKVRPLQVHDEITFQEMRHQLSKSFNQRN